MTGFICSCYEIVDDEMESCVLVTLGMISSSILKEIQLEINGSYLGLWLQWMSPGVKQQ